MRDQDPLAGRFAAFREASIATAQPPGVSAIQRTVAPRRAGRTLAAGALAVVALLTGAVLWAIRPVQQPRPAQSATPAPSAAVSATTTPTGQPTPSTSASPSPSPAGPKVAAQTGPPCSPFTPGGLLELMVNESNQLYVAPNDYFSRCPQARIRVYGARYQWDVNGQQYTLAHVDNVYLTAASPTAPQPTVNPATLPGCGYVFIVAHSNVDPSSGYPASLESAPANIDSYWSQHNLGHVLSWLSNTYTPAEQAKVVGCQPPGGPTASHTP